MDDNATNACPRPRSLKARVDGGAGGGRMRRAGLGAASLLAQRGTGLIVGLLVTPAVVAALSGE